MRACARCASKRDLVELLDSSFVAMRTTWLLPGPLARSVCVGSGDFGVLRPRARPRVAPARCPTTPPASCPWRSPRPAPSSSATSHLWWRGALWRRMRPPLWCRGPTQSRPTHWGRSGLGTERGRRHGVSSHAPESMSTAGIGSAWVGDCWGCRAFGLSRGPPGVGHGASFLAACAVGHVRSRNRVSVLRCASFGRRERHHDRDAAKAVPATADHSQLAPHCRTGLRRSHNCRIRRSAPSWRSRAPCGPARETRGAPGGHCGGVGVGVGFTGCAGVLYVVLAATGADASLRPSGPPSVRRRRSGQGLPEDF